ncbi:unnamed protein product [Diamesa tonsa]
MDISGSFRPEDLSKTDFFDFVSAPPEVENETATQSSTISEQQPLQGFDQFWGAEKETHRLETAIFDDLNYCWNQQSNNLTTTNSPSSSGQVVNPDGQIYTITVLNSSSTDQWLRKDVANNADHPHGLDLDTILSYYPNVKTECFSYDDSGFGTDHTKEDVNYRNPPPPPPAPQNLQQSSGVTTTTTTVTDNILLESSLNNNILSYTDNTNNNNNNEWHLDRNEVKDWDNCKINESPESLLRSALQGKGYSKTLQTVQNGITLISAQNSTKDEELRRVLFPNDQVNIQLIQVHIPQSTTHQSGVIVDDMFLTLDSAFNDDFEKIKRIASEVQQFCTVDGQGNGGNYSEVISIESTAMNATTTNSSTILTTNDITNNNNNNLTVNNNNNNTGNIKTCKNRSNGIKTTKNSNNNSTASTNANSATLCNGQRKERSLHYCSICSKGFKDKYSVNVHIRTHTGEKPFACSLCGKSFRQKAHLAKHYQTHLAAKNANGGNMKPSKMHQKNSLANNNNNNNSSSNNNNSNSNATQGQTGSIPSLQLPINIIAGR